MEQQLQLMDKSLRDKFPNWVNPKEMVKEKIDWILTDDIDSLSSIILLQNQFGKENVVNYYVDFNKSYINDQGVKNLCHQVYTSDKNSQNTIVGVDFALSTQTKCFDNHCSMMTKEDIPFKNKYSANLNNVLNICRRGKNGFYDGYYTKYSGSTLLMLMSLYNIDISNWNDEMLMILTCIDGLYISQKIQKINFKKKQDEYLKMMGYEQLIEFMQEHINKNGYHDFYDTIGKYKLNEKILCGADGKLKTNIKLDLISNVFGVDMSLPTQTFKKFRKYDKYYRNLATNPINGIMKSLCDGNERFFNCAITGTYGMVYSKMKSKVKVSV